MMRVRSELANCHHHFNKSKSKPPPSSSQTDMAKGALCSILFVLSCVSSIANSVPCTDLATCAACLEAGCFWQQPGAQEGLCDDECSIQDISCWGKTAHWDAPCPKTFGSEGDTSFLGEEPTICCMAMPSCRAEELESFDEPCTRQELVSKTCREHNMCCKTVYCRPHIM